MGSGFQRIHPGTDGHAIALDAKHRGTGAMDQDLAQVGVAALADAEQPRLVSGGVLLGHNPQPGRELTALAEGSPVADGGDDSGSDDWADSRDLLDAETANVIPRSSRKARNWLMTAVRRAISRSLTR